MRRDWSVRKAIVDLPIKVKGNSKFTSGKFAESVRSQTLLTEVNLRLQRRLNFLEYYNRVLTQEKRGIKSAGKQTY